MTGKLPPQAVDIEEAILGALMLEHNALNAVVDILVPESFYKESHKVIYEVILELYSENEPIDILTVTNMLRKKGSLEIAGGAFFIADLTSKVSSSANIEYHSRIIAEMAIKRNFISMGSELVKMAYDDTIDTYEIISFSEKSVLNLNSSIKSGKHKYVRQLFNDAVDQIKKASGKSSGITGIPSGIYALDKVIGGWQDSDLILIGARPSMGKCLGKGTGVIMWDGTVKKVEDLKIGDYLMSPDSKPKRIISLARGREKMYWVKQSHGMDYRVNESHILSLKSSSHLGKGLSKGDIVNIDINGFKRLSEKRKKRLKGWKSGFELPHKEVSVDPYFLGVWIGDGRKDNQRISNPDVEIIDFLKEYSVKIGGKFSFYKSRGCLDMIIKDCDLKDKMKKLGVLGEKNIPKQYLHNSKKIRYLLLAGLIDSDGYYEEKYNRFEFIQKSDIISNDFEYLCKSLGLTSIRTVKNVNGQKYNKFIISGDIHLIPTRVARKKAIQKKRCQDFSLSTIKIEYDCVDDYFGFTLDGDDGLFLLEDTTVTHNTDLAINFAINAAKNDFKVAIYSLEMSDIQNVSRMIAIDREIGRTEIRKGKLEDYQWDSLTKFSSKVSNNIILVDEAKINHLTIRSSARKLYMKEKINMIIIDYMQLIESIGKGSTNDKVGEISRGLKLMAKELNIPVIALSQLSRAVETRGGDKRPNLSDLRDSGNLEQDADIIIFPYRPEYYGFETGADGESTKQLMELDIAKHRNGSVETVKARYLGKFGKVVDWEKQEQPIYNPHKFPSNPPF